MTTRFNIEDIKQTSQIRMMEVKEVSYDKTL